MSHSPIVSEKNSPLSYFPHNRVTVYYNSSTNNYKNNYNNNKAITGLILQYGRVREVEVYKMSYYYDLQCIPQF